MLLIQVPLRDMHTALRREQLQAESTEQLVKSIVQCRFEAYMGSKNTFLALYACCDYALV